MNSSILRLLATALILLWGFVSFVIICGEDTLSPMTNSEFFLWKIFGLASMYGCIKVGKKLNKRGII